MNTNRPSLRLPGALLLLLLAISSPAQDTNRAFIFEADVKILMRDGVNLAANIFRQATLAPISDHYTTR